MSEAVHDLGALRALREVGRRGSIAAAAVVLGVSQQALSARMRTLERTTNVTLLARSPGGSPRRRWSCGRPAAEPGSP